MRSTGALAQVEVSIVNSVWAGEMTCSLVKESDTVI